MMKKVFYISFFVCAFLGTILIITGLSLPYTSRLLGDTIAAIGLAFLLLAFPIQTAYFKKQREEVVVSLDKAANVPMDSDRFCEITEALRNCDKVVDCTLGDAITWADVFFAIYHHSDAITEQTGITQEELEQWENEARLHHAQYYPFSPQED